MKKFKEVFKELVMDYAGDPMLLRVMDNGESVPDLDNTSVEDILNKYGDRLVDHYEVEFDSDFGYICATIYLVIEA